jgi:imidazolonepropionase
MRDAWLLMDKGLIVDYGTGNCPHQPQDSIDAEGGMVIPSFIDSHTHLVYAGNREDEFAQRLAGLSYQEIAARGGGILNSAEKMARSSEETLLEAASYRLKQLIAMGTGALEIKSGYGLSLESELKMLRVARQLAEEFPVKIKTSFLGAHAFPQAYQSKKQAYVDLIINEMLPALAEEQLADYIDVFCEEGYFDLNQTLQIVEQASQYGLAAKVHVNQFNSLGAVPALVDRGALSLDHLEEMTERDISAIAGSNTIATLLPGCSLFLEIPYAPARALLDQDAIVALASDFNPGSAPSGNMALMLSLACVKMKMRPEEALVGATLNGAAAIELSDVLGSIEKGKIANLLVINKGHGLAALPYHFGHNLINKIILNGKLWQS